MGFQIHALAAEDFQHLFALSDTALRAHNARKMIVSEHPGTPCRVSMADAELGEVVVLVNYTHHAEDSPYRASHAIFVRKGVDSAVIAPNEVPGVLLTRLISVRMFDRDHMMVDADVVEGPELQAALLSGFARAEVAYIHLHYAKPGCFAASVSRVT